MKTSKLYAYVALVNGAERIVMTVNSKGEPIPLIYTTREEAELPEVRNLVRETSDRYGVFVELREYETTDLITQYYPNTERAV